MDYSNSGFNSNKESGDNECVRDEPTLSVNHVHQTGLLDLSDDVLLFILRLCTPRDLKALGHTCPRLGALICDHTLWTRVDAREQPTGQQRLRWFLDYCLSPATQELKLRGYVNMTNTCLGIQDLHRVGVGDFGDHCQMGSWLNHLPRFAMSPRWPDRNESVIRIRDSRKAPNKFAVSRLKKRSELTFRPDKPQSNNMNANLFAESSSEPNNTFKIGLTLNNSNSKSLTTSSGTASSVGTLNDSNSKRNEEITRNTNLMNLGEVATSSDISTLNPTGTSCAADTSSITVRPCSNNTVTISNNRNNLGKALPNSNSAILHDNVITIKSNQSAHTNNSLSSPIASSSNSASISSNGATSSNASFGSLQSDKPGHVTFRLNNSVLKNLSGSDQASAKLPTATTSPSDFKHRLKKSTRNMNNSISKTSRTSRCPGPQFTLNPSLLRDLKIKCMNLTSLSLEYCNMDYKTTNLQHFPTTLKRLSLRGTMCFNLPFNTSYLRKIQDLLPALEYLDISECNWFEPSSLMSLSKLPNLEELHMNNCRRLTECVAYASLATRYGFLKLRILDVRGSMMADSEVSAFGWLPLLEELYVSSPKKWMNVCEHTHKYDDILAPFNELDPWEIEAPDYYRCKSSFSQEFWKLSKEEELWGRESQEGHKEPQEQLGDIGFGNYMESLESRIIVIQPNWNRNQNEHNEHGMHPVQVRDVLRQFRQPVLHQQQQEQRPPAPPSARAIQEPKPGPSNKPGCSTEPKEDFSKAVKTQSGSSKRPNSEITNNYSKRQCLEEESPSQDSEEDLADGNTTPKDKILHSNESAPYVVGQSVGDLNQGITVKITNSSASLEQPIERSVFLNSNRPDQDGSHQPDTAERSPSVSDSSSDSSDDSVDEAQQNVDHRRDHIQYRTCQEEECYFNFRGQNFSNAMVHNLVTDAAVFGFGRADSESINYVQIGSSSSNERGFKPNRSNLRVLSITGFISITDSSLQHLAVAAPRLRRINFSTSGVTAKGVDLFRKMRPDCEVIYSGFRDSM